MEDKKNVIISFRTKVSGIWELLSTSELWHLWDTQHGSLDPHAGPCGWAESILSYFSTFAAQWHQ